MKYAADFRKIARNALRGNWFLAVLTGFVASLIGALIASGGGSGVRSSSSSNDGSSGSIGEYISPDIIRVLMLVLGIGLIYVVIAGIVGLIIGGAGKLGYARFNLNLIDGKEAKFSDLFSQFHRLGDGFLMNLLMGIYIFLWSMLFVIPGIIKSFSYAMTPYIFSEHPEYGVNQAITESRRMMDGNKFRLFCLNFSFIGWSLLCLLPALIAGVAFTMGNFLLLLPLIFVFIVGDLFLLAYIEAANAAFYREVSGTEKARYAVSYTDVTNES